MIEYLPVIKCPQSAETVELFQSSVVMLENIRTTMASLIEGGAKPYSADIGLLLELSGKILKNLFPTEPEYYI